MSDKKGFILYTDLNETVKLLSDSRAGKLLKMVLAYVNGQDTTTKDQVLKIAFEPIKQQLMRDKAKWAGEVVKKSESGALGNLKRWHPELHAQVLTNQIPLTDAIIIAKTRKPSHTDSITSHHIAQIAVNDSVTVTENVKVNVSETTTAKPPRLVPVVAVNDRLKTFLELREKILSDEIFRGNAGRAYLQDEIYAYAVQEFFNHKRDTHEYQRDNLHIESNCRRNLAFWLGPNSTRIIKEFKNKTSGQGSNSENDFITRFTKKDGE